MESVCKYLRLQVDFASSNATCEKKFCKLKLCFRKLKLWFRKLRNCPATNQLSVLQRFLSSSYFSSCKNFASWNYPFHKLQKSLATHQLSLLQRFLSLFYFTSCENLTSWIPQLANLLHGWFLLCFSSLHLHLVLAKGYEAPKLSFFRNLSFNLLCHEIYKEDRKSVV